MDHIAPVDRFDVNVLKILVFVLTLLWLKFHVLTSNILSYDCRCLPKKKICPMIKVYLLKQRVLVEVYVPDKQFEPNFLVSHYCLS